MRWSVSLTAEGDRVIELAEVVELADAVAASHGIATGMGTPSYGAQIVVDASSSDEAVAVAMELFTAAAARAGLPPWPVTRAETVADGVSGGVDQRLDDGEQRVATRRDRIGARAGQCHDATLRDEAAGDPHLRRLR